MILTWTASGAGGHAGERVCSRAGAEATDVGVRGAALPSARFPGRSRGWTLDRAWVFRASRYPIGPSASGWVVGAVGRGSFCLGTGSLRVRVALVVGPECKGGMWTRDRVSGRTQGTGRRGLPMGRQADLCPRPGAHKCSQVVTVPTGAHVAGCSASFLQQPFADTLLGTALTQRRVAWPALPSRGDRRASSGPSADHELLQVSGVPGPWEVDALGR